MSRPPLNRLSAQTITTAQAWEDIAQTDDARGYIHPIWWETGDRGYRESGERDAAALMLAIAPFLRSARVADLNVLDVGCGDGRVTRPMSRLGFGQGNGLLVGLDTSPTLLDQLADQTPGGINLTTVQVQAGADWPELGTTFDLVYSVNLFIHLPSSEKRATLARIARVMAPGAVAGIQLPLYAKATEPTGWTSVGVWTRAGMIEAARSVGLNPSVLLASDMPYDGNQPSDVHHLPQVFTKPTG